MHKIHYSTGKGLLRFGAGSSSVGFDAANSLFHPLVRLIDSAAPRSIHLQKTSGKAYLNLVRALFHSGLSEFSLTVLRRDVDPPWEEFLYPLSKTFRGALVAQRKFKRGKVTAFRFRVSRTLTPSPHAVAIYLISDGTRWETLCSALRNIYSQDLKSTLVRVVGPSKLRTEGRLHSEFPDCKLIEDDSVYSADRRFPISKKKNLALSLGEAERIVVLHERIRLGEGWLRRLRDTISYFDLYTCAITTPDNRRYMDKFGIRFKGFPSVKKRHYFLSWREDNSDQLVDGGLFVFHRRALGDHRFDENLHWNEMEDVDLVLRMKQEGSLVSFDSSGLAQSVTTGHFSLGKHFPPMAFYKIWVRRWGIGYRLTRWAAILRSVRT